MRISDWSSDVCSSDLPQVGTGMVGTPASGEFMRLQIKVDPQSGIIDDVRFKTYGCGSAIAATSLATAWVKGKTLDQALGIRNTQTAHELAQRTEERRVGKECVSACRSRGTPGESTKKCTVTRSRVVRRIIKCIESK